jgi:DnaJ like chaperone protein
MAWWGKALGGAFGFMIGGPLGALMGMAFGHNFDRGLKGLEDGEWNADQERIQAAFFTATFSVMGYIAKADGKVSKSEIKLAETVMGRLGLDAEMRESAKRLFNEGRDSEFPINEVLDQFRKESRRRTNLIQMFLEIQIQAVYADGVKHPAEEKVLEEICQRVGISLTHLHRLEEMILAGFGSQQQAGSNTKTSIEDAYSILGANKSINDSELKKTYRRLMSQHHPDKLVARGLPEEMIKDATEKTQQIKQAYEQVKESRGTH